MSVRAYTSAVLAIIVMAVDSASAQSQLHLDPRTPVANAREIAVTLAAAKVVVVENATHQFDVFGSSEIRDVLGRFLRRDAVADKVILPPFAFQ